MIRKRTPLLLKNLDNLVEKLGALYALQDEAGEDLETVDEQTLKDAYQALKEFADGMDFENASFVLEEMAGYRLSSADRQAFEEIGRAVNQLDWSKVIDIIRQRKEELS